MASVKSGGGRGKKSAPLAKAGEIDVEHVYAESADAWRSWLEEQHAKRQSIWLVFHKKGSSTPSVTYSDAVDEALCFGWIDSQVRSIDERRYMQYFSVRKPVSNWSALNKRKLAALFEQGRMAPAGIRAVEIAKANGSWSRIDSSEALEVPEDLRRALRASEGATKFFDALARTPKRITLEWINSAKRAATREARIAQTVEAAARSSLAGPAGQQEAKRKGTK